MTTDNQPQVLTPDQLAKLAQQNPAPAAPQGASEVAPALTATEVAQTPSKGLLATPGAPFEVTLSDGRKVVLQKPAKPVSIFLAKVMGFNSQNQGLLSIYKTMLWVRSIDGVPTPPCDTEQDFEKLLEWLGDDPLDELGLEIFIATRGKKPSGTEETEEVKK